MEKIFEYEVAFSFLQQDEYLAYQINDLIQDQYSTFIYSEHQKEISGTDGEVSFNKVFESQARVVVVLYRSTWGKTNWTRIEETAIRNRGHEEGYDFTLFVQLDKNAEMPKWLPKTRIYYNFDRWGVKGLAPIIESKIQESGGENRFESLEDKKERIKRALLLKEKRQSYLKTLEAFNQAQAEFKILYNLLELKSKSLEDPEIFFHFRYEKHPDNLFSITYENIGLLFHWDFKYNYSLSDTCLLVTIVVKKREENFIYAETSEQIKEEYFFDINPTTDEFGWSKKINDKDFNSSEKLATEWLSIFLEKVKDFKLS